MKHNDLVNKFVSDRFSLADKEMDELYDLISKEKEFVREIKDNWLMDDYISRVIATDRQMFPAQVSKRISELSPLQKTVLTMDQIVSASKTARLSLSGRYRHKISERRPSPIASQRTSAISNRRVPAKKTEISSILWLVVAMFILMMGVYYFQNKTQSSNLPREAPLVESKIPKIKMDLPKIVAITENAFVLKDAAKKTSKLLGFELEVGNVIETGKGGSITLEYSDKTKVFINEESVLRISNSTFKEIYLKSGRISSDVSSQKNPFQITTDNSIVKVLGTSFNLGIQKDLTNSKNIYTELIVTKGKVEIENTTTKNKAVLTQGQIVTVKNGMALEILNANAKNLIYDFSSVNLPKGLELVKIKNAQIENGVLSIADGQAMFKFKSSDWKFPIKVSSQTKILPYSKVGSFLLPIIYIEDSEYGIFTEGISFSFLTDIWINHETYITEDRFFYFICSYTKGGKTKNISVRVFYLEKGKGSDDIMLLLKGNREGKIEFDNLEIREIKNSDVPDFQEAKSIFRNLPRVKDKQTILYEKFPVLYNDKKEYRSIKILFGPKAIQTFDQFK